MTATFEQKFQSFLAECLVRSPNATILRTTIRATYIAWNKNSTEGINKLYDEFRKLNTIDTKNLKGFALKPKVEVQSTIVPIPASAPINDLLAIEQAKLEQAEKARIAQELLEREKLELKRQKMIEAAAEAEKTRALQVAEAEKDRALKQQKLEQATALEREKIELERQKMIRMERMEYAKMDHITAENDKKIAHQSHENNLNRRLFKEVACPYFDVRAYGTPSIQFGSCESVQRVIMNNITTHDVIAGMLPRHQPTQLKAIRQIEEVIKEKVSACSEEIMIANERSKDKINAIDFEKMSELAEDIVKECQQIKLISSNGPWLETFNQKLDNTKTIAGTDSLDKSFPTHREYLTLANKNPRKSPMEKMSYIKPRNQLSADANGRVMISCYTCGNRIDLNGNNAVQRCHNVPHSQSGSWDPKNIFLCCATCNMDMADRYTVEEYAVELRLKQTSESESDTGSESE